VFGDIRHARCRYCCVLLNAHRNDLLRHSRSAKHATNIAFGRPCSNNELANEAITRSLMQIKQKKERLEQKKSRFSKLRIILTIAIKNSICKYWRVLDSIHNPLPALLLGYWYSWPVCMEFSVLIAMIVSQLDSLPVSFHASANLE